MKSIYKFITVAALLFTLGATSFAQSARRTVIHIPFDFVVGQKTLAAGTYRIESVGHDSHTTWEIRGTNGRAGAFVNTTSIQSGASERQSRLVFQKYGETYVLAEVWPGGEGEGRELAQSYRGRAADAEVAAGRAPKPKTITLAISSR
jgi:predicted dehydrogenase